MKNQIVKILSNLYYVNVNGKIYDCHSRGLFRKNSITPVVGDYVEIDLENKYILNILERKNYLERPLVANIDQAFIVTSCKVPNFSTDLLDKLLAIMHFNKIIPIICITKYDLLDKYEKKEINRYIKYYKSIGIKVIKNTDFFIKRLFKNKTTVFTGQTGAGKSSLLNRLNKKLNLETNDISKALGRGKHTTRHVELIEINGGKVLDTPGFSSIDFKNMSDEDIKNAFIEFSFYKCIYKNCTHINEKECLVKKAVSNNKIMESRYQNYKKMIQKR